MAVPKYLRPARTARSCNWADTAAGARSAARKDLVCIFVRTTTRTVGGSRRWGLFSETCLESQIGRLLREHHSFLYACEPLEDGKFPFLAIEDRSVD